MIKPKYLLNLPFYSVDSSSWNTGSRFGVLVGFDEKNLKFKMSRIKDKESYLKILKYLQKDINIELLLKDKRSYVYRDIVNIQTYKKMEKCITKLWKERGIVWDK